MYGRLSAVLFAVLALVAAWSHAPLAAAELPSTPVTADDSRVRYNRDVRPILSDKCFRCHGFDPAHREAGLRLDRREEALARRDGNPAAIVPGNSAKSELIRRITSPDADERMPPRDSHQELSPQEIGVLRRWIDAGAEYEPHWAFVKPQKATIPIVDGSDTVRNPIDAFVLAELERRNLSFSPEASRETLIRRLSLDLTGLPPTPAEVAEFVGDRSEGAYERVVDRLLASPRFGERLAVDWLDAARYADTNGYYTDNERQSWPWRDWVIEAFNANMPLDRFTVEQLAGDLLPEPTVKQRIATSFNRNHMVTNESGSIDEEFRVSYVMDRAETTAAVWLGLTMGCARCHDHKYDPLTQRDYYRFYAYFNSVPEKGLVKDPANPPPVMLLPTPDEERQIAELEARRKECEAKFKAMQPELKKALAKWEPTALDDVAERPAGARGEIGWEAEELAKAAAAVTVVGTLKTTDGVRGQAGEFDATQYVEIADAEPLRADRPFSLSIWIKPGSGPQGCVVSRMASTAETRGFEILWYKSQPRINLVHEWGRNAIEIVAGEKFSAGRWRHLAISYDGSSKAAGFKAYVDGRPQTLVVNRDSLTGQIDIDAPWRPAWKPSGIGFEGGLDELRIYDRVLTAAEVETLRLRDLLEGALALPADKRSRQQQDGLLAHFLAQAGKAEWRELAAQLETVRQAEADARAEVLSVPVMQELEQPRAANVLVRGQYDQPGEAVTPGVPAALASANSATTGNRLELARWIVGAENPLTSRVLVNRYWQLIFGEGLVRTSNDFGLQGEQPTHAELLDWLAVDLRASGWDLKRLLKQIVMSATYRQASTTTAELQALDPENRLLARGARYRMPAEMLRDQALAVSGLLVERVGGPSVKPYQPPGLWEAVSYNGDQSYKQDHGEGLYRRSLYTYWKRQSPPPGILTFDGPTREVCTTRRARTNTPLQALVLLNDVTFVEASRKLAERIVRNAQSADVVQVRTGFQLVTARQPTPAEAAALERLLAAQRAAFAARPDDARKLLGAGESAVDSRLDPVELAAWMSVTGVLLNLDEVVNRP